MISHLGSAYSKALPGKRQNSRQASSSTASENWLNLAMSPQPLNDYHIHHHPIPTPHTEIDHLRNPHRPTHPSLPSPLQEIPLRPIFKSPFSIDNAIEQSSTMAPHQHKRPYAGSQPSITSYFAPAVSPTNTEPHFYSISQQGRPDTRSPSLPANVQSNLLSVGMRVRKSVPEGYKTGSYSAFTLFSDVTPAKAPVVREQRVESRRASVSVIRPRAKELTPFCGLHSVGGVVFEENERTYGPVEEMDEDDDVPALSQSSTISNDSISAPSDRKRRLEFDEEDVDEMQFEAMRDRTMSFGLGARVMAVPRRKKKDVKSVNVAVVGQENIDDFDDADFLDYELIGRGHEVEMGGV